MTTINSSHPEQPLLTVADLGPLRSNFLGDAQAMLPPSLDDTADQIREQQALGHFLQKGVGNLLFNSQASAATTTPHIDEYYERVRAQLEEPDFLERLVADMVTAQDAVTEANPVASAWSYIMTTRKRRATKAAHAAAVLQHRQNRQATLAELRNQTFEAETPLISLGDLEEGETVKFISMGRTNNNNVIVTALSGNVLGKRDHDKYAGIVLLQVIAEERLNGGIFDDQPKHPGIVARLIGTGTPANGGGAYGGRIVQGQTLQFLTTEGRPVNHGQYLGPWDEDRRNFKAWVALNQVIVNGTELFPPKRI
jgi:hypothetical protein